MKFDHLPKMTEDHAQLVANRLGSTLCMATFTEGSRHVALDCLMRMGTPFAESEGKVFAVRTSPTPHDVESAMLATVLKSLGG